MLSVPSAEYCREIEAYLCRKNDGHLIRVVGPSFDLVSRWAADGVPLKVAFRGIDRHFERYYRKGPRRRPVRIDFCEADVLDVFDEWRRALGLTAAAGSSGDEGDAIPPRKGPSLPAHLERVLLRLTSAGATGRLGADGDSVIDRVSRELDAVQASAAGVRGDARRALLGRLSALDSEIGVLALRSLEPDERRQLDREADDELGGFRDRLAPEAYERARAVVVDRLARARFGLPVVSFG
jgi:hypothetical protein